MSERSEYGLPNARHTPAEQSQDSIMSRESRDESLEPENVSRMAELRGDATVVGRAGIPARLVIVAMLVLAVSAAVTAIWYLRGLSRRTIEQWGPTAGQLILQAPHIEAWRLEPVGEDDAETRETISVDGQRLAIVERRDLSQAPGVTNVRRALMNDASYAWDDPTTESSHWTHALQFSNAGRQATLLFSHQPSQVMLLGDNRPLCPQRIARGLQVFLEEQFPVSDFRDRSDEPAHSGG